MLPLMVVCVLLVGMVVVTSIKMVRQSEVMVIERLGKFHGLAERGLNIILPFVDTVRARSTSRRSR